MYSLLRKVFVSVLLTIFVAMVSSEVSHTPQVIHPDSMEIK